MRSFCCLGLLICLYLWGSEYTFNPFPAPIRMSHLQQATTTTGDSNSDDRVTSICCACVCLVVFAVDVAVAVAFWHCLGPANSVWRRTLEFINYDRVDFSSRRRGARSERGDWTSNDYAKNSTRSSRFIADLLLIRINVIAHFWTTCSLCQCGIVTKRKQKTKNKQNKTQQKQQCDKKNTRN